MTRYEFAEAMREKYLRNEKLSENERLECYDALFHTGAKLIEHFTKHEHILVSVSGGSDSDCVVHLICTYFPEYIEKCHFVYVDTGLEYSATKNHLKDLENKYGICIEKIRGISVVTAVRRYGIPILSKERTQVIRGYAMGQPYAIKRVANREGRYGYRQCHADLAEYIRANNIKISNFCCEKSKKKPLRDYCKENEITLNVTGERKAEGGQRASSHHSCHEPKTTKHLEKYMPLFWWSDRVKKFFKDNENLIYSDCYEVYGMKRTGCVGCPYDVRLGETLRIMQNYEPDLYRVCWRVFGVAYELTQKFHCRKIPIDIPEKI